MDRFIGELGTAYFWLTAVLLALAVNIVSSYAKVPLDAVLDKMGRKRRDSNASKAAAAEALATKLAANLQDVPFVVASELRRYLIGLYFTILASGLFYVATRPALIPGTSLVGEFAQIIVLVVGLGTLVLGASLISTGLDEAALLRRARELRVKARDDAQKLTLRQP
jgi:hypothetical protein